MTANVGNIDRIIRFVAGVALLALALGSGMPLFAGAAMKWGAIIVGAVLVLTSAFKFCPAYRLLGIRTCKVN